MTRSPPPTDDTPPRAALVVAAQALARGDPLRALKVVGPVAFGDPHALALRGIALSQLQEYGAARAALTKAAAAFERQGEPRFQARALAAAAEVAAAQRDLPAAGRGLLAAARLLEAEGDVANAAWVHLVRARTALLSGHLEQSHAAFEAALGHAASTRSPLITAGVELWHAEVALRSLKAAEAAEALGRARSAARRSGNNVLLREVDHLEVELRRPVARLLQGPKAETLTLSQLGELFARPGAVIVDAPRRRVWWRGSVEVELSRRPVLFNLLDALARTHPAPMDTPALLAAAFEVRVPNASHPVRLRVELARLRRLVTRPLALVATRGGWVLRPRAGEGIYVVAPLEPAEQAQLRSLLADGEAWSARSLALATGQSTRTVQRALGAMTARGELQILGAARSRRYVLAAPGGRLARQLLALGLLAGP